MAYGEDFGSLNADVNLTGREVKFHASPSRSLSPTRQSSSPVPAAITSIAGPIPRISVREPEAPGAAAPEWRERSRRYAARGQGHGERRFAGRERADVTFDGVQVQRPPSQAPARKARLRLKVPTARRPESRRWAVSSSTLSRRTASDDQGHRRALQHERRRVGRRWPDRGRRSSQSVPRTSTSPRCPDCPRTVPTKGSFAPRSELRRSGRAREGRWRPRQSSRSWGPGTAGRSRL